MGQFAAGDVPYFNLDGELTVTGGGDTTKLYSDGFRTEGANVQIVATDTAYESRMYTDSVEAKRLSNSAKAGIYSTEDGASVYIDDATNQTEYKPGGITTTNDTFTIKGVEIVGSRARSPSTRPRSPTTTRPPWLSTPATGRATAPITPTWLPTQRRLLGLGPLPWRTWARARVRLCSAMATGAYPAGDGSAITGITADLRIEDIEAISGTFEQLKAALSSGGLIRTDVGTQPALSASSERFYRCSDTDQLWYDDGTNLLCMTPQFGTDATRTGLSLGAGDAELPVHDHGHGHPLPVGRVGVGIAWRWRRHGVMGRHYRNAFGLFVSVYAC